MHAEKFVVYTAISKGYDMLKPPLPIWQHEAKFIAFMEEPQAVPGWEIRPLYRKFKDPNRNAKIHKILPHRYFPDAKYSLWLDGSVSLKSTLPLARWPETFLAKNDLAVFKHRLRNCLYSEGAACLRSELDADDVIRLQLQNYFNQGYPKNHGLAECTVLFRRHTKSMRRLNEAWYREIKNGSRRDQLSFNYIADRLNFKYGLLPGLISSNEHFAWQPHARLRVAYSAGKTATATAKRNRPSIRPARASSSAREQVSMVYLYYDNPQMLEKQIDCWNSYASGFKTVPEVLLIDDGSPRTFAADIVQQKGCAIPIRIFRINEDIPWNFAGARNLGCAHAQGWIYMSDIDTLLFAKDAQTLFEKSPLDQRCFYMPKRLYLPELTKAAPGIVNLLFHKNKYLEIGGYDEDYGGHYGKEETDYLARLKRVAKKVERHDALIGVVPPSLVPDSRTVATARMVRNKTRNNHVYLQKKEQGFINPVNPLRFTWQKVL